MTTLHLGDIDVEVILKDIKNVHLSVHPPHGRVRIAAPLRMNLDNIRLYAISKLSWIKTQRNQLLSQARETPREYIERESHYVWGKRYLLKLEEHDGPMELEYSKHSLVLRVKPNTSEAKRHEFMQAWYRSQAKIAAEPLLRKWEPIMGVQVKGLFVQRMKTRWGSCNSDAQTIRINPELVKKSPECLEYIVVHEMTHLLERTHNERFIAYLTKFLPSWANIRAELNRAPLAHAEWSY